MKLLRSNVIRGEGCRLRSAVAGNCCTKWSTINTDVMFIKAHRQTAEKMDWKCKLDELLIEFSWKVELTTARLESCGDVQYRKGC